MFNWISWLAYKVRDITIAALRFLFIARLYCTIAAFCTLFVLYTPESLWLLCVRFYLPNIYLYSAVPKVFGISSLNVPAVNTLQMSSQLLRKIPLLIVSVRRSILGSISARS